MTGQGPANPTDWEDKINALLDGVLDEASTEALKSAAGTDGALARAIVSAWQLQQGMDQLALEEAPASLRRKLRRIPREHKAAGRRPLLTLPRWALAGSLAALALIAVVTVMNRRPDGQAITAPQHLAGHTASEPAQVAQARRELAIAFYYLDKVGLRVGREIHSELNDELSAPIKENLFKHMPHTGQSDKEKHA